MNQHVELQITVSHRADTPLPNGNFEVMMTRTFRVAGHGPTNIAAFALALKNGGSAILENEIGLPGILLAQLGLKTSDAS